MAGEEATRGRVPRWPLRRRKWPRGRMHVGREHVLHEVEDLDELAEKITAVQWSECVGFAWRGLVFLNDSTGPSRLQEYAVFRSDTRENVESFTVSWMTSDRFREATQEVDEAEADRDEDAAWPASKHSWPCRWCG